MSNSQCAYESKRADKFGRTLEQWIGEKLSTDPLSDTIDAFLQCADVLERMLTPTPKGMVVNDRYKFAEMQKNKFQLFEKIKTLSAGLPSQP